MDLAMGPVAPVAPRGGSMDGPVIASNNSLLAASQAMVENLML